MPVWVLMGVLAVQSVHEDAHLLLEQVVDLLSWMVPLTEGVLSWEITMPSAANTAKLVASMHVTTSVVDGLSSKSRWQRVYLLLGEVLEHLSTQAWILDRGDDGGYVHCIWLSRRRSRRLLACLR